MTGRVWQSRAANLMVDQETERGNVYTTGFPPSSPLFHSGLTQLDDAVHIQGRSSSSSYFFLEKSLWAHSEASFTNLLGASQSYKTDNEH
jgi:hypothetical protein